MNAASLLALMCTSNLFAAALPPSLLGVAEGEGGGNLIPILIVAAIVGVILFVMLNRPSKDETGGDEETPPQAEVLKPAEKDEPIVRVEDYEQEKEKLSLAEVKAAKEAEAKDLSKEEIRRLRRERRAAAQTERAQEEETEGDSSSGASAETQDEVVEEAGDRAGTPTASDETSQEEPVSEGDVDAEDVVEQAQPEEAAPTSVEVAAEAATEDVVEAKDDVAEAGPEDVEETAPEPGPEPEAVVQEKVEAAETSEPEPEPTTPVVEATPESEPKPAPVPIPAPKPARKSTRDGLAKTRKGGFVAKLSSIFSKGLDDDLMDEVEEVLFTADIGAKTGQKLLDQIEAGLRAKELKDPQRVFGYLKDQIYDMLKKSEEPLVIDRTKKPFVILVIGVNGAGKTTTIGKIAAKFKSEGNKVMMIAGDTFRAAAIEQLEEWGKRVGCDVYRGPDKADPSSVMFDGIKKAEAEGVDVVLADTAGRLQNKESLMRELEKIARVSSKALKGAPHRSSLVLDATNGQNALQQAKEFRKVIDYTGIAITKLDGTAKGGALIGICDELGKPVHFIGIGERVDDLREFKAQEFVDALF